MLRVLPVLLVSLAATSVLASPQDAPAAEVPSSDEPLAPPENETDDEAKQEHAAPAPGIAPTTTTAPAEAPNATDVADTAAPQTPVPPRPPASEEEEAEQEKFRIALMDLEVGPGVETALAKAMTQAMTRELEATGVFEAVSTEEIRQMLALEETKAVVGCDTASCLAEIASALGAEFTVFGSIVLLDGTYLLQLQLVNAEQARTLARSQRTYDGPPAGLIETAQGLLKVLVRDLLDQRSGTLDVKVSESEATVRIDGVIVGVTPLPPLQAAGGFHTVTVEKEGFVRFSKDIEVKQDQVSPVDIRLRPSTEYKEAYLKRAWTWRIAAWSTWAAAGLSGAAFVGTVGGAALWTVLLNSQIDSYTTNVAEQTRANYNSLTSQGSALFALELGAVGLAVATAGLIAAGTVAYVIGDDPWHFSDEQAPPPVGDDTNVAATSGGAE
jgi:hypothetical protein